MDRDRGHLGLRREHRATTEAGSSAPGELNLRAMDESTFQLLADQTFHTIGDAFEDVDPDLVDCEVVGNVVTLTVPGGKRYIINTQRPTRQIWFAANARAWHFSW